MNASISKYAPKTKTYGMTISLTNRALISVGISNLTAGTYWQQVYSSLSLSMTTETSSFLHSQDTFRTYRKKYVGRTDIKSKRVKDNNMKIIELMEQQRKDIKRGVTYKSGCAIDSNDTPDYIRTTEMKKKEILIVIYPFYGCLARGHKTTGAKNCRYHGLKNLGQLNTTINDYLANLYQENYGEFNKGSSRTHPVVPTALLQIDYCLFARGLKIRRLLFMSGVLEKR